jgi:hypothetical protein
MSGNGMKSFAFNSRFVRARFARAVAAAAIGATVLVGYSGQSAWAADDDEGEALVDTKIIRHVLQGLGLRRDETEIDYRERSPLVLPANKDLPPPEPASPASKAAGWPDDPDIKRVKRRKDAEKNRKAYVEGVDDRPMLPSDYSNSSRTSTAGAGKGTQGSGGSIEEASRPSTLQELGSKSIFSKVFGGNKDEYQTFIGEPPRASLIDPPAGYRTPSPSQPFGVGKQTGKPTVIDRQEAVR